MPYTLADLSKDVRSHLNEKAIADCAPDICALVSKVLVDVDFRSQHLPDRAEGEHPREVLYEDPDLGFCICGHVYEGEAIGGPHDHGESWAIYGQAEGETEMTDWRIVDAGSADKPILVERETTYTMTSGDAHFYDVGAVHSPTRTTTTRLIRIEGKNLDHVTRSNIAAAQA